MIFHLKRRKPIIKHVKQQKQGKRKIKNPVNLTCNKILKERLLENKL